MRFESGGGMAADSWLTLVWAWLGLGVTIGLLAALTAATIHRRKDHHD